MVELYFVQQRIRACQRESSTSFNDLVHVTKYSLLDFCEFELRVILCPWLRQIDHHIARILIEDVVSLHIVHKRIVLSHFIIQFAVLAQKFVERVLAADGDAIMFHSRRTLHH